MLPERRYRTPESSDVQCDQLELSSQEWLYPSNSSYTSDRKILDMLPNRPPQVTFSCDKPSSTCQFQFWIGQTESFYCALDTCQTRLETGYDANVTKYACQNMKCNCVRGRMLCGEKGSIGAFQSYTV